MKFAVIFKVLGGIFGLAGVVSLFDSNIGLLSLASLMMVLSVALFWFAFRAGELGDFLRDLVAAEGKLGALPLLSSSVVFLVPAILALANPFPDELFFHFFILSIALIVCSLAAKAFLGGSFRTLIPIPFSVVGVVVSI